MKKFLLTIFIVSCFLFRINYCQAFEKEIKGSTGWATTTLSMRKNMDNTSTELTKVKPGEPFLILSENGNYWKIKYEEKEGYISNTYCMINLPDIIPSIIYKMANAESSIYKSSGFDIPNVTGVNLYRSGKVMNNKLGKEEYISPILYTTAKIIYQAQQSAQKDGYSLMIYDSYRPRSVSTKIYNGLSNLYNSNPTVRENIDYSTGASGTRYSWGQSWFLASSISSHNTGAAIDVTLYDTKTKKEVTMPTVMHELSTAAIKYYSGGVAKTKENYSTGMLNSEPAKKLDKYMTDAGMTTLASEWWHFQEQAGYERILNSIGSCDFYPTSIVSTSDRPEELKEFPSDSELKTIGDLNNDGIIDSSDAKLIYKLYTYLNTNTCTTCDTLIHYADINENGSVDANDIYEAIKGTLLSSTKYEINNEIGYIYTKTDANPDTINANIKVADIEKISSTILDNKYIVKYNDLIIKQFDIVTVNPKELNLDLEKDYIACEFEQIRNITVTNGTFQINILDNDFVIKYKDHTITTYNIVTYSSNKYDLSKDYINVSENNIETFLNDINCVGCKAYIFDGMAYILEGEFSADNELVIKYGDEDIKRYTLKYPVINVTLDTDKIFAKPGDDPIQLTATITPSMASNKNVTWESSNPDIASVDNNGLVTFKNTGTAIITVTTTDGRFSDTCEVTISNDTKYTVTYKDGDKIYKEQYQPNQKINFKTDLTKEGYRLVGYQYDSNNYELYDTLLMPEQDITLIARWEKLPDTKYTVTYKDGDKIYKEQYQPSQKINFKTDLTKEGYTLIGYIYNNKEYKLSDTLLMPEQDITLIASWKQNPVITYTVTYKDGDKIYKEQYQPNQKINFKTDLTKEGYTLIGYIYNNKEYKLNDTLLMPEQDITLIAKWVEQNPIIPDLSDYEIENGYIKNIRLGTNIQDFNLNLPQDYNVKITRNEKEKTTGLLGTGDVVNIYQNNNLISQYTVVIKGDLTGDGKCEIIDVGKLYKFLKKRINMDDYYIEAGNVYGTDKKITIQDVGKIYQFRKGKIKQL
ncbi:MAG: InlB B-repeat-containing protein [Bacilli bacterium]|nr:InlB B-repeat-containing protein [Bacilli bacterium]